MLGRLEIKMKDKKQCALLGIILKKSVKSARAEYKKAHNQAWRTFAQDRQNCKSGPTGESPETDLTY